MNEVECGHESVLPFFTKAKFIIHTELKKKKKQLMLTLIWENNWYNESKFKRKLYPSKNNQFRFTNKEECMHESVSSFLAKTKFIIHIK